MPVDLSKIGLEGLESFSQRQYMDAQSNYMSSLAAKQDQETQEAERLSALEQEAAKSLNDFQQGNRSQTSGIDPNDVTDQSTAAPLETVGNILLRGGATKAATEMLNKASEIRKRESDIGNDKVLAQQRKLENIIKGSNVVAQTIGIAGNQDEWNQGIKELDGTGLIEPHLMEQLKRMPYDPDVAAYFKQRAISAGDQARLELTAAGQAQQQQNHLDTMADADRRFKLQEIRDAETRRHNLVQEKNGGDKKPNYTSPSAEDLKTVKSALKDSVFKNVDITDEANNKDYNAAAVHIASRAKRLLQDNKALDWDTAIQQAIIQAQANGSFKITPGTTGLFGSGFGPNFGNSDDKVSYDGGKILDGRTAETAMAMPSDKKQMKKGAYYITARGRAMWNGKAFVAAD